MGFFNSGIVVDCTIMPHTNLEFHQEIREFISHKICGVDPQKTHWNCQQMCMAKLYGGTQSHGWYC